ncbi:hypothetical protein G2W53_003572 [Senna tora]|uniref:PB1-like domain-containing protein n=1 Tax=Senna tora TaxID=362788 RepID=A0A835CGJ1_9FABA|nr:hypothetical protein G2W53_003572 [Senna tora]
MEFFTIEVHYGGKLVGEPTFAYEGGHTGWLENCDIDRWSYWEVVDCLKELGIVGFGRLWFKLPGHSLENGLEPIEDDRGAMAMAYTAIKSGKIDASSCDEDDVQYESDDSALNIRFNDSEEEDGLFNHGLFDAEPYEIPLKEMPSAKIQKGMRLGATAEWVKELTQSKSEGSPHKQSLFSHNAQNHQPTEDHHQSTATPELPDLNYTPRHPRNPVVPPWPLQDILLA